VSCSLERPNIRRSNKSIRWRTRDSSCSNRAICAHWAASFACRATSFARKAAISFCWAASLAVSWATVAKSCSTVGMVVAFV